MTTLRSRVFDDGNGQVVRIPSEFRLDVQRVEVMRTEQGDLVIRPIPERRGAALLDALSDFGSAFTVALETDRRESAPMQDRDAL